MCSRKNKSSLVAGSVTVSEPLVGTGVCGTASQLVEARFVLDSSMNSGANPGQASVADLGQHLLAWT